MTALVIAAVGAAAALALALPPRTRLPPSRDTAPDMSTAPVAVGWMVRYRPVWTLLAGVAAATFVGGRAGAVGGVLAATGTWIGIARAEPPAVRRRREAVRRDLPHVVTLIAAALRGGSAPTEAILVVAAALPGPAAERLTAAGSRLRLGVDPVRVWEALAEEPALASLGRTLARAQSTGAPVVDAVERLAEELTREARADVEDRARAVGVKAAVPLGLCLLPAFVLIGIVPLVGGLLATLDL